MISTSKTKLELGAVKCIDQRHFAFNLWYHIACVGKVT